MFKTYEHLSKLEMEKQLYRAKYELPKLEV